MKKYYLLTTTEGCATNLLENVAHRKRFEALGYEAAPDPGSADLILINTCAYSTSMEERAVKTVTELQEKYVGKEIVLSGCLPKINPGRTESFFRGRVEPAPKPEREATALYHEFDRSDFRRLSAKHRFILSFRPLYFSVERALGLQFHPLHNLFESVVVNENFYLLTVSTGCVGHCTFCAIKRAKGKLISRPLPVVLSELEMGLKDGHRAFWLLGDDIGCWGQDVGLSVADLLGALLKRPERFSVVLNYLDPHFMLRYEEELRPLLSDPRVICINVPIQSASQRVLKTMMRDYDPGRLYRMIADVKARNPGLVVKTNVMAGFPGESWSDFLKSVRSVFAFDAILAMKYSARPHTPAEKFSGQVSERVKDLRLFLINLVIGFRHLMVASGSMLRPRRAE